MPPSSLTEANNDHGSCKSAECSTVFDGEREGSYEEDDETDDVDDREDDNGLISAKILIGDDSSNDRRHITPERPEVLQR